MINMDSMKAFEKAAEREGFTVTWVFDKVIGIILIVTNKSADEPK